jgi:hypothetical protein
MYWFSLDSHKVLMIPLSIKYSAQEFMEQTKNQAVNFKDLMDQVNEIASEELKEDKKKK